METDAKLFWIASQTKPMTAVLDHDAVEEERKSRWMIRSRNIFRRLRNFGSSSSRDEKEDDTLRRPKTRR